jgi:hypothetical protein
MLLPSGFLPIELRVKLFDVRQAQLSGFSRAGVGRAGSSTPDAVLRSEASGDAPMMDGDWYLYRGVIDSETGSSGGGAAGPAA